MTNHPNRGKRRRMDQLSMHDRIVIPHFEPNICTVVGAPCYTTKPRQMSVLVRLSGGRLVEYQRRDDAYIKLAPARS